MGIDVDPAVDTVEDCAGSEVNRLLLGWLDSSGLKFKGALAAIEKINLII